MRLSERIYRALLRAYPQRYRQQFGEPMAQLFSDQLRAAGTPSQRARLWMRTLADFVRTLPARHLEPPVSRYGFEAWNSSARRSIFFARYEASSFGQREITTEHLLLGILRADPPAPELAAAREDIRRQIEAAETAPRHKPPRRVGDLLLSFALRDILGRAHEEAAQCHARSLTTRHLLAAILQQEDTLAAQLLRRHGIAREQLRRAE